MKSKSKLVKKNLKLPKFIRLLGIMGVILFAIIITIGIILTKLNNKYIESKINLYSYDNKGEISYSVGLLPNDIYADKTLPSGGIYMFDMVDLINTSFKYDFTGDKEGDIKGSYEVIAILNGKLGSDKEEKNVWEKTFTLIPKTEFENKGMNEAFKFDVPVNIKSYVDISKKISLDTDVNFNSELNVIYKVTTESKTDKGISKEQLSPTIKIPLNNKYFQVGGTLKEDKKGKLEETVQELIPLNKPLISILSILLLLDIISIIIFIRFTESIVKDNYIPKKLNQIIKTYGDRIVTIENLEKILSKIYVVLSIEDLIKVADELGKPVLYKKTIDTNEINRFYVMDNESSYIYELNDNRVKVVKVKTNSTIFKESMLK